MPKSKPPKNKIPPDAAIYASVTASVSNGVGVIHVHGPGGPLTSGRAKKGAIDIVLPSTTIENVTPGKWHVAWDGIGYRLMPTLESIQETEDLTLVGSVAVPPFSRQASAYAAAGIDVATASPLLVMAMTAERREYEGKEIVERPPLPGILCDQIDLMLYKVDEQHYRHLAAMQVPNELPLGKPRPPRMPSQLLNQLQWYASVLFTREVEQYGSVRRDARYETWLLGLADRIVTRVVDAVYQVDKGSITASLKYHGLSPDKTVAGLRETLSALVSKYVWEQSPEYLKMKAQTAELPAVQAVPAPVPLPAQDTDAKANREELRDSYRAMFPDVRIADIIWAAQQTRREWTRWITGKVKDGLKPDRSFRKVLTSGRKPEEILGKPRPTKYNA